MSGPVTTTKYDQAIEEHGMRRAGMLGRGPGMGNALYAIDYDRLPVEARNTIKLIINDGPFPYPVKDGTAFGNRFGDLPGGQYLEYTVPTPGVNNRGARRIVARKVSAQLFFTACHYERVGVSGGTADERNQARVEATKDTDAEWRNGFYIITGMSSDLRNDISKAIKAKS
jgi:guanyl-specific ribonuclease Sa